jgi:hypothetical protein
MSETNVCVECIEVREGLERETKEVTRVATFWIW